MYYHVKPGFHLDFPCFLQAASAALRAKQDNTAAYYPECALHLHSTDCPAHWVP